MKYKVSLNLLFKFYYSAVKINKNRSLKFTTWNVGSYTNAGWYVCSVKGMDRRKNDPNTPKNKVGHKFNLR